MRALQLVEDRKVERVTIGPPPPPGQGEVRLRVQAVALNHIDVWGWRGMAFAKRNLPLVTGAEAVAEVVSAGWTAASSSSVMPRRCSFNVSPPL